MHSLWRIVCDCPRFLPPPPAPVPESELSPDRQTGPRYSRLEARSMVDIVFLFDVRYHSLRNDVRVFCQTRRTVRQTVTLVREFKLEHTCTRKQYILAARGLRNVFDRLNRRAFDRTHPMSPRLTNWGCREVSGWIILARGVSTKFHQCS
jgi:hypothetical protein